MNNPNPALENHPAADPAPAANNGAPLARKRSAAGKIVVALILLCIALGLWHLVKASLNPVSQEAPGAPAVAVAKAARQDLARYSTLTAEFVPYQEVSVHAKVAGYVKSIGVDIGDHVKEGQVMALLEVPELKDELNKASAALLTSQAEVGRAQADFDDADLVYKRLVEVAKANPKLIAQQDLDNARTKDESARSALDTAQQKVQESQAEVAKEKTLLDYCSIPAPFNGVITHRYADTGALVQAGTSSSTQAMPVVDVAEDDVLRLIFPAPESIVPVIRDGLPVEVSVNALNLTFPGKIARYAGKVDVSTRTMRTEVDVPNPDGKFTPGMYADVKLPIAERKNVVTVPIQALSTGDNPTVLVLNDKGEIEERKVTVGMETSYKAEILSGLREGELVVVGSRSTLRPGQKATGKIVETPSAD